MTYQQYVTQMLGFRQEPMDEKQFNIMMNIETDQSIPPLQIRPKKDARPVDATLKNYEAMK